MKLELKPFNKGDWDCFAGVSGKNPKIDWGAKVDMSTFPPEYRPDNGSVYSWCVIADKDGIEIQGYENEDAEIAIFILPTENQLLSEVILKGMKYPFDYNELIQLGFQDII